MWLIFLRHWKLALGIGLFITGNICGWYITAQHYQAKESRLALNTQIEMGELKEVALETGRKASYEYQIKAAVSRGDYLAGIKRVREHYCMPTASTPAPGHSPAPPRDGLSCQGAENIIALMWVAQEQAYRLKACQEASNGTNTGR